MPEPSNTYTTEDYEVMRGYALKLKGLQVAEDLPVNDFLDRCGRVMNDLAIEPEWTDNQQIMQLIEGFNGIWKYQFQPQGYNYDTWIADLKSAAAEDLDEF